MAEAVRSHRDQRELFDLLARELRRVVPFDAIAQYDDAPRKVRWHLCADDPPHEGPKSDPTSDLHREETLAWWVHEHQEIVVVPDLLVETRFPKTTDRLRERGMRSLCALPLTTRKPLEVTACGAASSGSSADAIGLADA